MTRFTALASLFLFATACGAADDLRVEPDEPVDAEAAAATSSSTATASAIAVGSHHACVLTREGGVRCWGGNIYGQLGRVLPSGNLSRVPVAANLPRPAVALGAGYLGSCAVLDDGSVSCWGNFFANPQPVAGLSGARAVAVGEEFSCALLGSGQVWCWGINDSGQLGRGNTTGSSTPAPVILASGQPLGRIVHVSAGRRHACAHDAFGTSYCWGDNGNGRINGSSSLFIPHASSVGASGARGVIAGLASTCQRRADATIGCWGSLNHSGTLVTRSFSYTGGSFCALSQGGAAHCWGLNADGQLGDGTTTTRQTTAPVLYSSNEVSVAVSTGFGCALRDDGTVRCWGTNNFGQLGNGSTVAMSATPVQVTGLGAGTGWGVAAGGSNLASSTCALKSDGTVRCWGANGEGQLGDGTLQTRTSPVTVNLLAGAAQVDIGSSHACAVRASGSVQCWGRNTNGQLGDKTTTQRTVATTAYLSGAMHKVATGTQHTCALRVDGDVKCWGNNLSGKLGRGTASAGNSLIMGNTVAFPPAEDLDAGSMHTCAVTGGGDVYCWGQNLSGQLGDGTTSDRHAPTRVPGVSGAIAISAGESHTCALIADGTVRCWGANSQGQLGDGTLTQRLVPVTPGNLTGAVAISAGKYHTCAITAGGETRCWGYNGTGQLGDGGTARRLTPTVVSGGDHFVDVSAGSTQTCAMRADGTAACWGRVGLSSGANTSSLVPVTVGL